MKKKWIVFLLTAMLCLSLTACAKESESENQNEADKTEQNEEKQNELNEEEQPNEEKQNELNDEEKEDETNQEENSSLPTPPVLMRIGNFTGLQQLENNNNYNGGYLYRDLTEDTLTVIINCCFMTVEEEYENLEEYIRWTAHEIGGEEPQNLTWAENAEHTQRLSYPAYILSWQTGANEDTRGWDALFFMTDTHTYLYAFDTAIDNQEEMQSIWQDVFGMLNLE